MQRSRSQRGSRRGDLTQTAPRAAWFAGLPL
jgi:hypothetical protein